MLVSACHAECLQINLTRVRMRTHCVTQDAAFLERANAASGYGSYVDPCRQHIFKHYTQQYAPIRLRSCHLGTYELFMV